MLWVSQAIQMEFDQGEREKFLFLYEQYYKILLLYARGIVKSEALAEEVVQDAYIRVLKNLQKIDLNKCSETKAYLVTIVKNCARNVYHREVKTPCADIDACIDLPGDVSLDPTWEQTDAKMLSEELKEWIGLLSEREQMLLTHVYLKGWSYEKIEQQFGIRPSTASSIVCRARTKLKAMHIKERGENCE